MGVTGSTRKAAVIVTLLALCGSALTGCGLPGGEEEGIPGDAKTRIQEDLSGIGAERETGDMGAKEGGESDSGQETGAGRDTAPESAAEGDPAVETLGQWMPDGELCKAVADAAGIMEGDTGETLLQKLEQCQSLTLNQDDIYSLEGLGEALPNLRELNIAYDPWDYSRIEDYSPIGELSHLEELRIAWPAGEDMDLSFLAGMGTVTELDLFACDLGDALFLKDMPQLKRLSLGYTPVGDLAVLEDMTGLVKLKIYGDKTPNMLNVETVGGLTDLQELELQDCGVVDISFLSALTGLRSLDLACNSVSDISSLAYLDKLERLDLTDNRIGDISALQNLTHLYQVSLSGNQITDLWPLSDKPDLLYLSVSGNPCTDPGPVLTVPYLYFESRKPPETEEQTETVAAWMARYRPDMEEYECFDFKEADLNGDGLPDAAFVVNGDFMEEEVYSYNNERRLFILLRNQDGSFSEVEHDIRMGDLISGGGRGDPYRGIWMGNGYVLAKSESGSGVGTVTTKIYRYKQGGLEPVWTIVVDDCWDGDTVSVYNEQEPGNWVRYAIALDEYCTVRVDLANGIYPATHKALPEMDRYYVHRDKLPTRMDGTAALECFRDSREGEWTREELPYASWQKENYELLKGVDLPDHYYEDGDAYFFYYDLESFAGEYYHVIRYVWGGKYHQDYKVKDSTGEIEG